MALQHHEFELRLRDVELLRLHVQAGMAEREMQSASLKKFELAYRRFELEAKNLLREPAGPRLRRTRHAMRQRWPSWRPKGSSMPEHR